MKNITIVLMLVLICILCGCKNNISNKSPEPKDNKTIASITTIGANNPAMRYGDYGYEIIDDGIMITSFSGDDESVTIPNEINNKPVKAIGNNAFYQCVNMKSIVLPDSITSIEHSAFYRCCTLKKINISQYVEEIGSNPFFRCSSLAEISVDADNKYFCSNDGVLFNKDKTVLLVYPEGKKSDKYVVPESVKSISYDAFGYYCNFTKIYMGKNIQEFPDSNMFHINSDEVTLFVKSNSHAEKYAKKFNLKYEIYE